jgi:hypothetical protein
MDFRVAAGIAEQMRRCHLILLFLISASVALHAQKVNVDWDRTTDFSPYKTYKWEKIPTPRTPSSEMENLIHQETEVQLEAKGLKKVEGDGPDLYVGYSITLGQPKQEAASTSSKTESAWQTGGAWSGDLASDKAERKGTLRIEIADRRKNLLVWRGTVMAEVGDSVNDARAKVSKGISKAFAKFPPPPK